MERRKMYAVIYSLRGHKKLRIMHGVEEITSRLIIPGFVDIR
jgi:hypothetical protein